MYHELLKSANHSAAQSLNEIHTGYYGFYFEGGWVRGNVIRIGDKTLDVDIPFLGKILNISVVVFLDSSPSKL